MFGKMGALPDEICIWNKRTSCLRKFRRARQRPFLKTTLGENECCEGVSGVQGTGIKT
jgi:hypothetical protein